MGVCRTSQGTDIQDPRIGREERFTGSYPDRGQVDVRLCRLWRREANGARRAEHCIRLSCPSLVYLFPVLDADFCSRDKSRPASAGRPMVLRSGTYLTAML